MWKGNEVGSRSRKSRFEEENKHIGCLGWWLREEEQKRSQNLRGPNVLTKRTVDSGKGL